MKNFKFKLSNTDYDVHIESIEDNVAKVNVNGVTYEVEMDEGLNTSKTPVLKIEPAIPSTAASPSTARTASPDDPKGVGTINSPLPGKVLDIFVQPGDKVTRGQTLLCLEAMKMENNVVSDLDGTVKSVRVQKNDTILEGHVLFEIG